MGDEGMRIWVSRPEPGAGRTARRLAERGHAALVAPVLRIAPSDGPPPAGRFDGLILTSANAAAPLAGAGLSAAPVFAVGARTAERAARAGLHPVLCADGDAADLARLVAAHVRPGGALLHAAGEDRKAEPAARLTAEGYLDRLRRPGRDGPARGGGAGAPRSGWRPTPHGSLALLPAQRRNRRAFVP
jgi:uroporphyrinogen-III synthase